MSRRTPCPGEQPFPAYEHTRRVRVDVAAAVPVSPVAIANGLMADSPRAAASLIRLARADSLELAVPSRYGRPRPPFDLASVGLGGLLRCFLYRRADAPCALRAALTTKAPVLVTLVRLRTLLVRLLGIDIDLGVPLDDSREFYIVARRSAVEHAASRPGSMLGAEREDCTLLVLGTWLGPGTGCAERLYVSLRWYSFDEPEVVKVEVRVGAHQRRRKAVCSDGLRRAALTALTVVVAREGLECVQRPERWVGLMVQSKPHSFRRAERRTLGVLGSLDAASPIPRLHRLSELLGPAGLSPSQATAVMTRLAGQGLVEVFAAPETGDKRRKSVRLSEAGWLHAWAQAVAPGHPSRYCPISVVGPYCGSVAPDRSRQSLPDTGQEAGESEPACAEGLDGALAEPGSVGGPRAFGTLRAPTDHGHGPWARCMPVGFYAVEHPVEGPIALALRRWRTGRSSALVPWVEEGPRPCAADFAGLFNIDGVPSVSGLPWSAADVCLAAGRAPAGTSRNRKRVR